MRELCWELGVAEAVRFTGPVDQASLAQLHHESDVILAPLTANDRNLVQGCCPLKVLEAMASCTPLVASDLPVVRELVRPEEDALLVRPGSAKAIKDAVLRLVADPTLGRRLASRPARPSLASGPGATPRRAWWPPTRRSWDRSVSLLTDVRLTRPEHPLGPDPKQPARVACC